MRNLRFLVVCCLVLTAVLLMRVTNFASTGTPDTSAAAESDGEALCGGEPCGAVLRGAFAFFDRRLHGLDANGRACADCHMATDRFQLSPASVEARFQLLQWRRRWNANADDPLFRPLDADDFRTKGKHASDFSNFRQNGLVRISFATVVHPPDRSCDRCFVCRDVRRRVARGSERQRCCAHRT